MATITDGPVEVRDYRTTDSGYNAVIIVLVLLVLAIIFGFWWNGTHYRAVAPTNTTPSSGQTTSPNNGGSVGGSINGSIQGSGSVSGGTGSGSGASSGQ